MPPREGAFAELLRMPERNLVTVPDHVASRSGGAGRAHCRAAGMPCGWALPRWRSADACRALVIGGGAIGLAAALSCKAQWAAMSTLTSQSPTRPPSSIWTSGAA
jgi:L-gulonate 5-dehydrogenase